MAETWILVPPGSIAPGRMVIDGEEAAHLVRVRRRPRGSAVVVIDGAGARGAGTVVEIGRQHAVVEIVSVDRESSPPGPGVTLAMAVLHGAAMDVVVHQAVELGACRLIPLILGRAQRSAEAVRRRQDHWQRISRQALKQCRRVYGIELAAPRALSELIAERGEQRGTVADPAGGAASTLAASQTELLLVGPEGGLDPDEERALDRAAWPRLGLGRHILRAETAAAVGLSVLTRERQRRGLP